MTAASTLINRIVTYLVDPFLMVVFAAGLFLFLWGLLQFMLAKSRGEKNIDVGKDHMIWGIVGMFVMVSVYGIISLLDNTFGLNISSSNPSINDINVTQNSFFQ